MSGLFATHPLKLINTRSNVLVCSASSLAACHKTILSRPSKRPGVTAIRRAAAANDARVARRGSQAAQCDPPKTIAATFGTLRRLSVIMVSMPPFSGDRAYLSRSETAKELRHLRGISSIGSTSC